MNIYVSTVFFKCTTTIARWIVWLKDLNCLLNLHRAKSEILLRTFKFRLCQISDLAELLENTEGRVTA